MRIFALISFFILTSFAVALAQPKSTNVGYTDTVLIHNPMTYNTAEIFIRVDSSTAWIFNRLDSTWRRLAFESELGIGVTVNDSIVKHDLSYEPLRVPYWSSDSLLTSNASFKFDLIGSNFTVGDLEFLDINSGVVNPANDGYFLRYSLADGGIKLQPFAGGDTLNFANTNLTFTGNRSHNASNYNLSISNIGELYLESTDGLINAIAGDGTYITDNNNIDLAADARMIVRSTAVNDTHAVYLFSSSFMKLQADSVMTFIDKTGRYTLSELAATGGNADTAKVVANNGQVLSFDGTYHEFFDSGIAAHNTVRVYDDLNYISIGQWDNQYGKIDGSANNLLMPDEVGIGYNNMSNFPNKQLAVLEGFTDDAVEIASDVDTVWVGFLDSNTTNDQQVGVGAVADNLIFRDNGTVYSISDWGGDSVLSYKGILYTQRNADPYNGFEVHNPILYRMTDETGCVEIALPKDFINGTTRVEFDVSLRDGTVNGRGMAAWTIMGYINSGGYWNNGGQDVICTTNNIGFDAPVRIMDNTPVDSLLYIYIGDTTTVWGASSSFLYFGVDRVRIQPHLTSVPEVQVKALIDGITVTRLTSGAYKDKAFANQGLFENNRAVGQGSYKDRIIEVDGSTRIIIQPEDAILKTGTDGAWEIEFPYVVGNYELGLELSIYNQGQTSTNTTNTKILVSGTASNRYFATGYGSALVMSRDSNITVRTGGDAAGGPHIWIGELSDTRVEEALVIDKMILTTSSSISDSELDEIMTGISIGVEASAFSTVRNTFDDTDTRPLPQTRVGTTAMRPASPVSGDIYFNTTTSKLQVYDGSTWQDLH